MTDSILGAVWGIGLRWARSSDYKGHKKTWGGDDVFIKLTAVMVSQMYTHGKID